MSKQPKLKPQRMWAVVLEGDDHLKPWTFTYAKDVAEGWAERWNNNPQISPSRVVCLKVTEWTDKPTKPTKRKAKK